MPTATSHRQIGAADVSPVSENGVAKSVRRQVRGPAIGLLVTGILNAVATLAIGMLIAWYVLWGVRPMPDLPIVLAFPFVPSVAFTIVIIVAALKMRRLDGYGWAVFGSILAVISGNVIGLAAGIWSLVVLSDMLVKKAFEEQTRLTFSGNPPQPTAWHRRFGGVALAIFLLAIPLSLSVAVFVRTEWLVVFLMVIVFGLAAILLGLVGWRSKLGKTAVIGASFLLLPILTFFVAGLVEWRMHLWRDFGGWPSVERVRPKEEAANKAYGIVDVREHPDGPWIARLPNGITAELLGVGENKKEGNGRWWQPDGSPIKQRPYETFGGLVYGENVIPREFAVRLGNLPVEPVGTRWQFEPSSGSSAGGDRPQTGPENTRVIAVAIPTTARMVNIHFGLAAGPWKTVAEGGGGNSTALADGTGIAFSNPYAKDGGVVIPVAHTITDQEVRVVAVGKDGHEHYFGASSAAGAANMSQITATFPKILLKDIQTFRLQSRPFQWVEFRNVAIQPEQSAEAKTDDMQAYLNETQELVRQQRYAEALERFVWFHDHALEHNPGMAGVRLSFALSYWKNLGDVYPPAKQSMIDMRDRKTRQLQDNRGNAALFQDVAELNRTLGEDAKTVRLFQGIDKTNPSLAAECWWFARLAVFREKQYDLAKKYVKSPLQEYDAAKANHDLEIATQTRLGGPQLQHLKQMANDRFIEECLRLIGLATFIGDNEAAQEIRKHAASVVNDPRLQETPQKPVSAGTVMGQYTVTSGKVTDQGGGGFHLVRGTTLWLGSIGEPFVYDDYDKHFYMAWGSHIVVLPKPAEGFGDFYSCRTLHPGVGRMAVSDVHSASGQPTNVAMPGAIDLPTYQLLLQPSVQQALKLSDEQRGKLQDISAKYWTERKKIAGKELDDMETSSQGELAAYSAKARHGICQSSTIGSGPMFSHKVVERLDQQWSNARKEIEDVLTPEQLRTLKALTFRTFAFGSGVMFEPEVLDKIGVPKEERDKLQTLEGELQKEKGRQLRSVTREKIKKMLAVLTPEQQSQLRKEQSPDKNPETDCSIYPYPQLPSHMPDTGVADELGFSQEQRESVRKTVAEHWKSLGAFQQEEQGLSLGNDKAFKAIGERRRQEMADLRKKIEAVLTPEQWASCKEMAFQNLAIPALRLAVRNSQASGDAGIGLNEQQKTALREIDAEYFDKPERIYCELTDKALAAFTPAQQEELRAEVDRRGW